MALYLHKSQKQEYFMKINNEINNNFELLAGSKHEQASFSMLSGLFGINFGEVFSENNTEENLNEFILNEDEIKLIDYISNLIPSLDEDNKKIVWDYFTILLKICDRAFS